jgi:hypothetical protein
MTRLSETNQAFHRAWDKAEKMVGAVTYYGLSQDGRHLCGVASSEGHGKQYAVDLTFKDGTLVAAHCGCDHWTGNYNTLLQAAFNDLSRVLYLRICSTMPLLRGVLVCKHIIAAARDVSALVKAPEATKPKGKRRSAKVTPEVRVGT